MDFLKDCDRLVADAVAHYWKTLTKQAGKQLKGKQVDRGNRSAVTGGKQMAGFCKVVTTVLERVGLDSSCVHFSSSLELPGYFRPTKNWDMLVVHEGNLVAAMEFKSQRGPSFGNNFNNRSEEAIGTSHDLWVAYREKAFGPSPKPWLGWVMLVEDCKKSQVPVAVKEPNFKVFKEFKDTSYAKRYEILVDKLVRENLYTAGALLLASEKEGLKGKYSEPSTDLSMQKFLGGLAGHVMGYLAGQGKGVKR